MVGHCEAGAVKRVAVLGAGTIGGSWVAWFLARGMQVTVWDPRAEAADFVPRYVADAWPAMARLGMTADASADAWRRMVDFMSRHKASGPHVSE